MKRISLLLILPVMVILSCASGPRAEEPVSPAVEPQIATPPTEVETVFDPDAVTEERYESTLTEIRTLIDVLNRIIRARDYNAWVSHLADSYFELINSEEFLAERTEDLFRRNQIVATNTGRDPRSVQRIVLRNSRDFFTHVVVPARSNDRLDDITFVSENRVLAYTIDRRGNRLILYDLEVIDNRWKIIN